jgi:hypothetical protein
MITEKNHLTLTLTGITNRNFLNLMMEFKMKNLLLVFILMAAVLKTHAEVDAPKIQLVKGCLTSKYLKVCSGDNIYMLEKSTDNSRDEEDEDLDVRVDRMRIDSVKSVDSVEVSRELIGKSRTVPSSYIIAKEGCLFKTSYCIGEKVFIPGHIMFTGGKIVGIFLDGRLLVERLKSKTVMNRRDLVRLRKRTPDIKDEDNR